MIKAFNFTKKDEINSVSSTPVQKFKNEKVTVIGAAITERPDEATGEAKKVGILVTKEYGTLSTISTTALKSLDMIIDYMDEIAGENGSTEDVSVEIFIKSATSNSGREFLTLEII